MSSCWCMCCFIFVRNCGVVCVCVEWESMLDVAAHMNQKPIHYIWIEIWRVIHRTQIPIDSQRVSLLFVLSFRCFDVGSLLPFFPIQNLLLHWPSQCEKKCFNPIPAIITKWTVFQLIGLGYEHMEKKNWASCRYYILLSIEKFGVSPFLDHWLNPIGALVRIMNIQSHNDLTPQFLNGF